MHRVVGAPAGVPELPPSYAFRRRLKGKATMRVSDHMGCHALPCRDVRHGSYLLPEMDGAAADVRIVLISEAAPPNPADWYCADGHPLFQQTTVQAFCDAGADVGSARDILNLGVCLTTAVKRGETGYSLAAATIGECSRLLEQELNLSPNVRAWLLMGDVAIKAVNCIARRSGKHTFRGARAFPFCLQAGPSPFIGKTKRTMIAQDTASALDLASGT